VISTVLAKTIKDLLDLSLLRLIMKCLVVTLIFLLLFIIIVGFALSQTILPSITALKWIVDVIGFMGASVIAWFLFPSILTLVGFTMDEEIAATIERKNYPSSPKPVTLPYKERLRFDLKIALYALLSNIILFPLYFIPAINLVVYYSLNGYFLGKGFFEVIAARHIGFAQARILRKKYWGACFLMGVIIIFISSIPIVNLISPFMAVAMSTHLFMRFSANSIYGP
jgi:CysZ protein